MYNSVHILFFLSSDFSHFLESCAFIGSRYFQQLLCLFTAFTFLLYCLSACLCLGGWDDGFVLFDDFYIVCLKICAF